MLMKHSRRNGKLKRTSWVDHWTHVKSKLLVTRDVQCLLDMDVYEYSTEAEARARTGRNPVGLKWIDTNKGSGEAPRYHSRLVCTEVRHKGVEPIFSATPPLEALRVLLCVAFQEDVFRVEDPFLISIADLSRAHFYSDAVRDVYSFDCQTKTPKQRSQACVGNCVRQCTDPWMQPSGGEHCAPSLEDLRIFPRRGITVHFFPQRLGDDALRLLRGAYELSKGATLGPESSQSQSANFLGRTPTLRQLGIEYEPDQQHVSRALKALGLTTAKGVATPGTNGVGGPTASEISVLRRTAKWHDPLEEIKEDDLLIGDELKLFQNVAARFKFLAMDWSDLMYSVKELMRKMAPPRTQDLTALKGVARYTSKYPRMTCRYAWTELDSNIEVFW